MSLGPIPSIQAFEDGHYTPEDSKNEEFEDFAPHIINKVPRSWISFLEDISRELDGS